ncbi:MAG: hypothetical protein V1806_01265 [Pseudomonadota bacterium]
MRCFVVISGAGTMLVLSTFKSSTHPTLVRRFKASGISRMILMEVPLSLAEERYGEVYQELKRLISQEDFRILDLSGASVLDKFSFSEMGQPIMVEF